MKYLIVLLALVATTQTVQAGELPSRMSVFDEVPLVSNFDELSLGTKIDSSIPQEHFVSVPILPGFARAWKPVEVSSYRGWPATWNSAPFTCGSDLEEGKNFERWPQPSVTTKNQMGGGRLVLIEYRDKPFESTPTALMWYGVRVYLKIDKSGNLLKKDRIYLKGLDSVTSEGKLQNLVRIYQSPDRSQNSGEERRISIPYDVVAKQLLKDKTTTVTEVSKALGISRSTLYRYVSASER